MWAGNPRDQQHKKTRPNSQIVKLTSLFLGGKVALVYPKETSLPFRSMSVNSLALADDWRPDYHFSPGAELQRLGAEWPRLAEQGVSLVDGWRFSDSQDSRWYIEHVLLLDLSRRDPETDEYPQLVCNAADRRRASQYRAVVERELVYRMRHISEMRVQPEAQLMEQPVLDDLKACLAPGDIVLRRVGDVQSALVSSYHRRHPVDANMAIIRGLNSRERVWLAFCINQPLYKSFLEQRTSITSLVRVGLKQLAAMPVAKCPRAFYGLADEYLKAYDTLMRAEDKLCRLRTAVKAWLQALLPNGLSSSEGLIDEDVPGLSARFFAARDLGQQLSFSATQQSALARRLIEEAGFVKLAEVAEINPKASMCEQESLVQGRVIKIGDLDGQLAFRQSKVAATEGTGKRGGEANKAAEGWRTHKRPLSESDVLVSSFVHEPKVAMVRTEPAEQVRASEQLAVLHFHRTPGAYALIMESPLIKQQIAGLATGTVQRFVQPKSLDQLVVPALDQADRELANRWHYQLLDLIDEKKQAQTTMNRLQSEMYAIYRQVHPSSDLDERVHHKGVARA